MDAVRDLLQMTGIDVNTRNGKGETPFHIACKSEKSLTIIELLLDRKDVDLEAEDRSGYTPLMRACSVKNFEVVDILLARGVSHTVNTGHGSPLQVSIQCRAPDVLSLVEDKQNPKKRHLLERRTSSAPSFDEFHKSKDGPTFDRLL